MRNREQEEKNNKTREEARQGKEEEWGRNYGAKELLLLL